jgi:hypothetical protein
VHDFKVGPAKVDFIAREGQDVTQTTDGKTTTKITTTVNSQVGIVGGFGPYKLGVERTDSQEEGKPRKVEWVPGYQIGKLEGDNAKVGIGLEGCVGGCGQVEVGIQLDKVINDVRDAVGKEVEKILTEPITQ